MADAVCHCIVDTNINQLSPQSSERPPAISIPKNRSAGNLLAQGANSLGADVPPPRARLSVDAGTEAYDGLTRYVTCEKHHVEWTRPWHVK